MSSPYAPPGVDAPAAPDNQIVVTIPGVSRRVSVVLASALSGRQLLVDGQPAEKAGLAKFKIPADSGEALVARFHEGLNGTNLVIGKDRYAVGPRIPAFLTVLVFLPIGLIATGGLIGGAFGGGAMAVNYQIARSKRSTGLKVVLMLAALFAAAVATLIVAGVFLTAVNG